MIGSCAVCRLVLREAMSDLKVLTVVRPNGEQISVECLSTDDTYASLVDQIQAATGIPQVQQRLAFGDIVIPNDDGSKTLESLGVTSDGDNGIFVTLIRVQAPEGIFRGYCQEGKNDGGSLDWSKELVEADFTAGGWLIVRSRSDSWICSIITKYEGQLPKSLDTSFEVELVRTQSQFAQGGAHTEDDEGSSVTIVVTKGNDDSEVTLTPKPSCRTGPFRKQWVLQRWQPKDKGEESDQVQSHSSSRCCIIL